jgi:prepilin-type N-terminal cleavage/methylation domain-containing protein
VRSAFTLIELACVIAVIGIMAATSVPIYDTLVRRAHTDEARTMVQAIAHAELRHFRDRGTYIACPSEGEVPKTPVRFSSDRACWRALGILIGGTVRYRYGVELDGTSFVVTAEGDLDRDGTPSRFRLHGKDFALTIEDELE